MNTKLLSHTPEKYTNILTQLIKKISMYGRSKCIFIITIKTLHWVGTLYYLEIWDEVWSQHMSMIT